MIEVDVTGDVDDTALERLARSTERSCVVGQSLREPPRVLVRRVA